MERSGNMYRLEPNEAFSAHRSTTEGLEEVVCQGGSVRVEAIIAEGEASEISLQWNGKRHHIFGHESFEEVVYINNSPII